MNGTLIIGGAATQGIESESAYVYADPPGAIFSKARPPDYARLGLRRRGWWGRGGGCAAGDRLRGQYHALSSFFAIASECPSGWAVMIGRHGKMISLRLPPTALRCTPARS